MRESGKSADPKKNTLLGSDKRQLRLGGKNCCRGDGKGQGKMKGPTKEEREKRQGDRSVPKETTGKNVLTRLSPVKFAIRDSVEEAPSRGKQRELQKGKKFSTKGKKPKGLQVSVMESSPSETRMWPGAEKGQKLSKTYREKKAMGKGGKGVGKKEVSGENKEMTPWRPWAKTFVTEGHILRKGDNGTKRGKRRPSENQKNNNIASHDLAPRPFTVKGNNYIEKKKDGKRGRRIP